MKSIIIKTFLLISREFLHIKRFSLGLRMVYIERVLLLLSLSHKRSSPRPSPSPVLKPSVTILCVAFVLAKSSLSAPVQYPGP